MATYCSHLQPLLPLPHGTCPPLVHSYSHCICLGSLPHHHAFWDLPWDRCLVVVLACLPALTPPLVWFVVAPLPVCLCVMPYPLFPVLITHPSHLGGFTRLASLPLPCSLEFLYFCGFSLLPVVCCHALPHPMCLPVPVPYCRFCATACRFSAFLPPFLHICPPFACSLLFAFLCHAFLPAYCRSPHPT